ncbi:DUF4862 family protein [Pseudarthrobacter sp. J1763]|uniref:DUF4862 family protein n=1 Tax=Pseudarthrobacter sp. J1763 TaxID=3420445 RepID=UPI003D2CAA1E
MTFACQQPRIILSGYAAAPALVGWNLQDEAAFLAAAAELPHIGGFEIPFYASGQLHKYDGDWFLHQLRHMPADFDYVLTTIPDTMDRLVSPAFGLASKVTAGRKAALARAASAAEAVRTLNKVLGRKAVRAVHLYSAPRLSAEDLIDTSPSSVAALTSSLQQLAEYDWDGALPVLEHCDATSNARLPVKGFMQFEQEIEAVVAADSGIGVSVNWARSVIENRDTSAPQRHAERAAEARVLAGFILSGCSDRVTEFGGAWDDTHLPPAPVESSSLLTSRHISSIATMLEKPFPEGQAVPYRGLKVSAPAGFSVEQRVKLLARSIDTVHGAGF